MARGEWAREEGKFGSCECPNKPHAEDTFGYKAKLLYGDFRKINAATDELSEVTLFACALTDWNLVDAEGEPLPITIASLDKLSLKQAQVLIQLLDTPEYTLAGFEVPDPKKVPSPPSPESLASTTDESSAVGPEDSTSSTPSPTSTPTP